MRVAVNTRLLIDGKLDGIGWFTHEVMRRLALMHPEHEFLFLFDRAFDPSFIYSENVKGRVLFPQARHPLLYRMYFEYSIPNALRQWKPDVFFSPDGFLSTKVRAPQVPVIHDINFEHRPQDLPKAYSQYYRNFFPRFASIARNIITVSNYSADDIAATYGISRQKITVANNGANEAYRPLVASEKKEAQKRFGSGRPYFIFVGNFSYRKNIHGIIRAYERYRKNGGESRLVLVGNPLWTYDEMNTALSNSDYEADVLFPGHLRIEEMVQALGGASALLFPSYFEGFGIPILEAFAANVPVITANTTSLPEVAGDAALFAHPDDVDQLAHHMADVENDQNISSDLISKGIDQLEHFSWDLCANKVSQALFLA